MSTARGNRLANIKATAAIQVTTGQVWCSQGYHYTRYIAGGIQRKMPNGSIRFICMGCQTRANNAKARERRGNL